VFDRGAALLTETGIDLLPVLAQLARWGRRHMPVTPESGAHAGSLEAGGSALLDDLRTKLRLEHLDPV
jgi:hypothetical protein